MSAVSEPFGTYPFAPFRAVPQGAEHVRFVGVHRQDDDRRGLALPGDLSYDLKAVESGQCEIQHQHLRSQTPPPSGVVVFATTRVWVTALTIVPLNSARRSTDPVPSASFA